MTITMYNQQQTTAFRVGAVAAWNREYRLLRFPEAWKDPLLALSDRGGEQYSSIRIQSLNSVLAALAPDVIAVAKSATRGNNQPWLLAEKPIDAAALFPIITAWVRGQRRDNLGLVERTLARLQPTDLEWERIDVDFQDAVRHAVAGAYDQDGSAAQLDKLVAFRLLPHELAARLSAEGMGCEHRETAQDSVVEGISRFRRCPTADNAQIMSWPPHANPTKPFSFMVDLSVQTRPFDDELQVYAHVGARRWVHRTPSLDTASSNSVYFLPSVAWLPETKLTRSFHRAQIRVEMVDGPRGRKVAHARWHGLAETIIEELGVRSRVELPEQIRRDPKAMLDHPSEAAGLVFRNGLYTFPGKPAGTHPVAPGASVRDRNRLIEWIAEATDDELSLAEPCARNTIVAIPGLRKTKPDAVEVADADAKAASTLRSSIRDATGTARLLVEIYHDTTRTLTCALETLQVQLGVKFQLPEALRTARFETAVDTEELAIALRVRPIGELAADLETKAKFYRTVERLQEAVARRAEAIKAQLSTLPIPEDTTAVALIEIGGKDRYAGRNREKDPKFALRHGFARTERLTQFVTPVSPPPEPAEPVEGEAERPAAREKKDPGLETLSSCWRDLWRQLGARRAPIPPLQAALPADLRYLAFWVVRQNQGPVWGATRCVPIAVMMNADGTSVQVRGPGMKDFQPVHTGVLELSRTHVMASRKHRKEEVVGFFQDILSEEQYAPRPTLLLTNAHNLRSFWPFLQNGALVRDALVFNGADVLPITGFAGFRHVRIRTDTRNETPEGYAVDGDKIGHSSGTWVLSGDRVFLSTGDKPHTAIPAIKDRSKVESRAVEGREEKEAPKLKSMVWNHQLIEMAAVALQPDDTPGDWIALAHELRWASAHFSGATVLPWPMHLARLIGEYILPIQLIDEIENPDGPPEQHGAASFEQVEIEFEAGGKE